MGGSEGCCFPILSLVRTELQSWNTKAPGRCRGLTSSDAWTSTDLFVWSILVLILRKMNLSFPTLQWKVGELVSRVLSSCNNDSVQILVWRLLENTALLFLHCSFCGFACFPELTMLLRQSSSSYISAGSLAAVPVAGTASVCHCTGWALSVASVPTHLPQSHHWPPCWLPREVSGLLEPAMPFPAFCDVCLLYPQVGMPAYLSSCSDPSCSLTS